MTTLWINTKEQKPPLYEIVFVTNGDYVGLAKLMETWNTGGRETLIWNVPGVGGWEWELDEPTHWMPAELPEPLSI